MTHVDLWPHQKAAIKTAMDVISVGRKSGLWALPTGTGKTVAFTTLARRLHSENNWGSTLILVHRDELIQQTISTLEWLWPKSTRGVIKGPLNEINRDVVVASVQSLHADRLERFPRDLFDLLIADEAHHYSDSTTWSKPLEWFDAKFILGVTATPERHDGQGLERFGERPIYHYPLRRAIEDGQLVRLRQYGIETGTDLDGVKRRMGDFVTSDLSREVNTPERNMIAADAYMEHAEGRRAIVFCVDRQHIQDMTATFNDMGITATFVDGTLPTEERRSALSAFRDGRFKACVSCEVLTEGFDDPGVSAVIMARPTGSRPWYTQAVGRGLRLFDGKDDLVVLDLTDNSRKHKLVTALSLLGKPDQSEMVDANGRDVINAVDEEIAELERVAKIQSNRPLTWRVEERSPWPELPTLNGYVETEHWHSDVASPKQEKFIASFGVDIGRHITKGEASWLINQCLELDQEYPQEATIGQKRLLLRRKVVTASEAESLTKREASRLIAKVNAEQGPELATRKQISYLRYLRALPANTATLTVQQAAKLITQAKRG